MKLHYFCFLEIHPVKKKKKSHGGSRFIPTSHDSQHLGICNLHRVGPLGAKKKKRSGIFSFFFTFVGFQVFLILWCHCFFLRVPAIMVFGGPDGLRPGERRLAVDLSS